MNDLRKMVEQTFQGTLQEMKLVEFNCQGCTLFIMVRMVRLTAHSYDDLSFMSEALDTRLLAIDAAQRLALSNSISNINSY
jgi:hypothetical protein